MLGFHEILGAFLERLHELHPIARGLSPEGHCNFLMGDVLPHETENTVYRYLIAISKLRLGILTEQGEGSQELVPFLVLP
jgi:hypothetical protein